MSDALANGKVPYTQARDVLTGRLVTHRAKAGKKRRRSNQLEREINGD